MFDIRLWLVLHHCRAIKRSNCFHANIDDPCHISNNPWIIFFGVCQIFLSQIQDIDRIWFMSVIATVRGANNPTVPSQHPEVYILKGGSSVLC